MADEKGDSDGKDVLLEKNNGMEEKSRNEGASPDEVSDPAKSSSKKVEEDVNESPGETIAGEGSKPEAGGDEEEETTDEDQKEDGGGAKKSETSADSKPTKDKENNKASTPTGGTSKGAASSPKSSSNNSGRGSTRSSGPRGERSSSHASVPSSTGLPLIAHSHRGNAHHMSHHGHGDIPLRILVSSEYVGAVIGRSGGTIREITQASHARVDVHRREAANALEKVITIHGTPDSCSTACSRIMEVVTKEASSLQKGEVPLKILVPNNLIGRIIGKSGASIKRTSDLSGCEIQVNSYLCEKQIVVRGNLENMSKAEELISEKVRKCIENDMAAAANYYGAAGGPWRFPPPYPPLLPPGPPYGGGGGGGGGGGPRGWRSQAGWPPAASWSHGPAGYPYSPLYLCPFPRPWNGSK